MKNQYSLLFQVKWLLVEYSLTLRLDGTTMHQATSSFEESALNLAKQGFDQNISTLIDDRIWKLVSKLKAKILLPALLITVIISVFIIREKSYQTHNSEFNTKSLKLLLDSKRSHDQIETVFLGINEDFARFAKEVSADNVTLDCINNNHSIIKQAEKLVMTLVDDPQIQSYFSSIEVSADKLINCLYTIYALASYCNYNEHDGEKARKLLQCAKQISENYLINRSKLPIDFSKLPKEETYAELATIKDMPEMYTKIIYLLGIKFEKSSIK